MQSQCVQVTVARIEMFSSAPVSHAINGDSNCASAECSGGLLVVVGLPS